MDRQLWENVKDIVCRCLDADPGEQKARIMTECSGDPSLIAEVESLLASYHSVGDFLEPAALQEEEDIPSGTQLEGYEIHERISPVDAQMRDLLPLFDTSSASLRISCSFLIGKLLAQPFVFPCQIVSFWLAVPPTHPPYCSRIRSICPSPLNCYGETKRSSTGRRESGTA